MAEELHPPAAKLGRVPRCVSFNGQACKTIVYSPQGNDEVDAIMGEVARSEQAGPALPGPSFETPACLVLPLLAGSTRAREPAGHFPRSPRPEPHALACLES